MAYDDSKYKILELHGMPAGVFGTTYVVVVGIHTMDTYHKGEFHIITQRPSPQIESGKLSYDQSYAPEDQVAVNLDLMLEQSKIFAENRIYELLEARAEELNAPHILVEQEIDLQECPGRPFVGCRFRNVFDQQFTTLAKTTECKSLYSYLLAIRQIKPIERG